MFHQVTFTRTQDNQGNRFSIISRYDNHGKVGYVANRCGSGRIHRMTNTSAERVGRTLAGMGYHFMYTSGNTSVYGKLVVT
jgi:hypothetical protein